jgi:carboxyl-terminal processing protease
MGVMPGDRIIKVDGRNIAGVGITTDSVFSMLRGDKGSQVTISVKRKNRAGLLDFNITRDKIPIYSLDASYKIADDIGYIKVNRFALTTMDEFRDALQKLKKEGVSNLVLDLTGNGGGYLEVAIELADEFLDANKLIVYTEGLNSPKREYRASKAGDFEKGNLVVLIDEGSASASEIFTGAIQDWDRGIIVGRRSFGKGLVQKPLLLPDQSMIRLTIARYFTPTGRLIQKPYDKGTDEYNLDLVNRYNNGEFSHSDSIHFPDSLKYYTLKNTRVVYGGGGIMPDYFVSLDTSYYTNYYNQLLNNGTLVRFALEYVDINRNAIMHQYKSFDDFRVNYTISDETQNDLVKFAEKDSIAANPQELAVSKAQIERVLKAYIARDLWTNNEFYEIINEGDDKFQTAVMILKNWNKYEASLLNQK